MNLNFLSYVSSRYSAFNIDQVLKAEDQSDFGFRGLVERSVMAKYFQQPRF